MDLVRRGEWARGWLFEAALPLWLERGADYDRGGWFDKLDQAGAPLPGNKRARVQARQIFVYAEAARLGWSGDWELGMRLGLDFLLEHFRRDDGLFRASVDAGGAPVSGTVDLYDQAFVLFALAAGYRTLGRPADLLEQARALMATLQARLAHPARGFEEASPRVLPLRSNPHMHMLEAMLAWIDAGVRDPFESTARAIIDLALERLIDPATGAIGEYYDGDWNFAHEAGHIREPGHQFEWAYLLDACAVRLGGDHGAAVRRLAAFGNQFGVIDGRTVFSLTADGTVIDGRSRLWATTERMRTMTVLATSATSPLADSERPAALQAVHDSCDVLARFMAVPVPGLWSDWLDGSGALVVEPVPASSLYHIVTGLVPLIEAVN